MEKKVQKSKFRSKLLSTLVMNADMVLPRPDPFPPSYLLRKRKKIIESSGVQGHVQLDQVAQSPVQPDLECSLPGMGHLRLWATCARVSAPSSEEFLPCSKPKSTFF